MLLVPVCPRRVRTPVFTNRVQRFACASRLVGFTQRLPDRCPVVARLNVIVTVAARSSEKRNVVPIGARRFAAAAIAVGGAPTRKTEFVSRRCESTGRRLPLAGGAATITVPLCEVALP